MSERIFVPTLGPTDWRRLLADPKKHWRREKSAYELAVSWEAARETARGLPVEVANALDAEPHFAGAELLLAVPEHQVQLRGGGHASQTDLWCLLSTPIGVVSVAIEGKAGEDFDLLVPDWLRKGARAGEDVRRGSGKPERLRQLCGVLGLNDEQARSCRYQLLHRPAAGILEAVRFGLRTAMFLVQSFDSGRHGLGDYRAWARHLEVEAEENHLHPAGNRGGVDLWVGWLSCQMSTDEMLRAAVAPGSTRSTTPHRSTGSRT